MLARCTDAAHVLSEDVRSVDFWLNLYVGRKLGVVSYGNIV